MLSGELARSAQKLQREQKQRFEALQRKAEREKAVQERLRKQREGHEEELRQRRLAELAAIEAVRIKKRSSLFKHFTSVWPRLRVSLVELEKSWGNK